MKRHSSFGFIYILSNPAMPDCFKIGMTEKSPHYRAQELSKETGIPEPFSVEYYAEVDRVAVYERLVHRRLAAFRVSPDREFFRCDVETAIEAIRNPTGDEFGETVPHCECLVSHSVYMRDLLMKHASWQKANAATDSANTPAGRAIH